MRTRPARFAPILGFALAAGIAPGAVAAAAPAAAVATLTDVEGDVDVVRAADGEVVDAEEDLDLFEGDAVVTGAGAHATVGFLDDHLVNLAEGSRLVLRSVSVEATTGGLSARVQLAVGRLFASFAKLTGPGSGFAVETPTAVAAVKGTTFAVEAAEHGSTVSVLEGTVATAGMEAGGRETGAVDVGAGQETAVPAVARRPTPPRAFSGDPRRAWVRERLEAVRAAAGRHRDMRRSGELDRNRRMRHLARAAYLADLKRDRPGEFEKLPPEQRRRVEAYVEAHRAELDAHRGEVSQWLARHPEMKERLRKQAEHRVHGRRRVAPAGGAERHRPGRERKGRPPRGGR